MKIPQFIVAAFLGSMLALEGWTLLEVVNLKVAVAELKASKEKTQVAQK